MILKKCKRVFGRIFIMIFDFSSLSAEIDRFVASVQKFIDALENSAADQATIAALRAELEAAAADNTLNAATIADLTARLKEANDLVDAASA